MHAGDPTMAATFTRTTATVLCWISLAAAATAQPPTCTVHFFDWYAVSDRSPLAEIQKRWTYQIDWQSLGIAPEDIGNTVHYYEVQCRKIKEAGFDGLHYEWHGNPMKSVFAEALQKTNLPAAMFYDMDHLQRSRPAITDQRACGDVRGPLRRPGRVVRTPQRSSSHTLDPARRPILAGIALGGPAYRS
jgi:hypothetical protein